MSTLPRLRSSAARVPDSPWLLRDRRRAGKLCDKGNIVRSGRLSWPHADRHRLDALCVSGLWYGLLARQRFRRLQKLIQETRGGRARALLDVRRRRGREFGELDLRGYRHPTLRLLDPREIAGEEPGMKLVHAPQRVGAARDHGGAGVDLERHLRGDAARRCHAAIDGQPRKRWQTARTHERFEQDRRVGEPPIKAGRLRRRRCVTKLDASVPTAFVDMAGSGAVLTAVHNHFRDNVKESCIVGATHWEADRKRGDLPGAKPAFFFAPAHIAKRNQDWGDGVLISKAMAQSAQITASIAGKFDITHARGAAAVEKAFLSLVNNDVSPSQGLMLSMKS